MARATLSTVQRLVYDNLGVTDVGSGYGNLLTSNERYSSGYINDKIAEADIATVMFLLKEKQHQLLVDLYQTVTDFSNGNILPNNWAIIEVTTDNGTVMEEVSYAQWQQLRVGGIYDNTYLDYYAKKDGKLFIHSTSKGTITYIDLTHPSTLSDLLSPTGFEGALANLASANLLMKRGDKPEQAKYYKDLYVEFMQAFMSPDTNAQDEINS